MFGTNASLAYGPQIQRQYNNNNNFFQEDNMFGTNASLAYGPQIQRHVMHAFDNY